MKTVLSRLKAFLSRHLLLCALLWLMAAVAIACEAFWQYSQGKMLQAFCLDLPFVALALLAAFASAVEWKSRSEV